MLVRVVNVFFLFMLPAVAFTAIACVDMNTSPIGTRISADYGTPDSLVQDPPQRYCWPGADTVAGSICTRFNVPETYHRSIAEKGSFAMWLRHLPLLQNGSPVMLYNGKPKPNQSAHLAVVNIDVGNRDLQQCADAVMRLRAEYLFAEKRYSDIAFHYTNGERCSYTEWCNGTRINTVKGGKDQTSQRAELTDHNAFRQFMDNVFMYAGTLSLSREMKSVRIDDMQIGDVFIKGGSPGHACLVADMAINSKGEKVFLLLQSYMPAQRIQVLQNPSAQAGVPWYPVKFGDELITPEWTFKASELKRF